MKLAEQENVQTASSLKLLSGKHVLIEARLRTNKAEPWFLKETQVYKRRVCVVMFDSQHVASLCVSPHSASVVIGAPKADTRQVNVTEGGSVFYCPWSLNQTDCHTIDFDTKGKSLVCGVGEV